MPWVRAMFKGQRIYARAKASGELDVVGGRVEIRYKPGDGRMYQAGARNLTDAEAEVLADDTCATAEPAKAAGSDAAPKRARTSPRKESRSTTPVGSSDLADATTARSGKTIVYTDGACTGNPGPAGIGVVVLLAAERVEVSEYLGFGTNNIAELVAIERGIEEAPAEGQAVVVHTDSQYAIGVLSKGWKAKANTELIDKIKKRIRAHGHVSFVYVPGHAGVPLNERCDELARLAIRRQSNQTSRTPV